MNLRDALHTRRTIHRYKTDALPEGAIERALAAAIMAPNHRLTWPWRFVRVGRDTRARIADLAVRLKQKPDVAWTDELEAKVRDKILNPAELVVVSIVRHADPSTAREDYAAAACAIQNLTLSLTAEGVGTKWSSGKVTCHAETYELLGIEATEQEIIGFVWAGIAADEPKTPERPPLDGFVRQLP
ncbi:MAG: nitroreductase [Planctomycetes bacterium]|nr:nitroreductase [Planctomycetota bacterium]